MTKSKFALAYALGRARVRTNFSIALIFINILLMIVGGFKAVGFNVAFMLICGINFLTNSATIKKIEKDSNIKEDDLVSELEM